jgi:glycosyltransferase involved in cell wall biosynthesis
MRPHPTTKVMIVLHSSFVEGGAFISMATLLNSLRKSEALDFSISLYGSPNASVIEAIANLGLPIDYIGRRYFGLLGRYIGNWPLGTSRLSAFARVIKDIALSLRGVVDHIVLIQKVKPDIIHYNSSTLLPMGAISRVFHRSPIIIHERERAQFKGYARRFLFRLFSRNVNRFICIAEPILNNILQSQPKLKGKVLVIPNPIDLSVTELLLGNENFITSTVATHSIIKLAFFGGSVKYKGGYLLLKTIEEMPRDYRLYFIGSEGDTEERADVNRLIAAINQQRGEVILCHGTLKSIRSAIEWSDIVCVPHEMPHFSRVIIEAWSARKPVVAFADAFTTRLNEDSCGALTLARPYSFESLREEIIRLIDDKFEMKRTAELGYKYWLRFHSPASVTAMVESIYGAIVSENILNKD